MKVIFMDILERLIRICSIPESRVTFIMGILAGLILIFLLGILLRVLILILRREKKIPEVNLKTDAGMIKISANAISDLVHSISGRHPLLEAERSVLVDQKGVIVLKIRAFYTTQEGSSLMDVTKAFQDDVLATLKDSMKIDVVEKVVVSIPRCRS